MGSDNWCTGTVSKNHMLKISDKFLIMSFLAMLMVVMIHSPIVGGGLSRHVIHGLTQWAVPWFFFASGVFFKCSCERYAVIELARRKFWSLLIPFLLWSLIWRPLGGTGTLWFLRSLICFTSVGILAKCIHCGVRFRFACIGLTFVVMTIMGYGWFIGTPTSPFYFLAGILLSDRIFQERHSIGLSAVIFLAAIAVFLRAAWFILPLTGWKEIILRNGCVVSMSVALWFVLDYMPCSRPPVASAFKTTFFVYCFHEPVIRSVKHFWVDVAGWGHYEIGFWLLSITMPPVCICTALLMKKILPRIYSLLSGGR